MLRSFTLQLWYSSQKPGLKAGEKSLTKLYCGKHTVFPISVSGFVVASDHLLYFAKCTAISVLPEMAVTIEDRSKHLKS